MSRLFERRLDKVEGHRRTTFLTAMSDADLDANIRSLIADLTRSCTLSELREEMGALPGAADMFDLIEAEEQVHASH